MSDARLNLIDAHSEFQTWLKDLEFYKEELGIFKKRLLEVSAKNNGAAVAVSVGHFDSQFTIHESVLSDLRHEIQHHENGLQNSVLDNPTAAEHRLVQDHPELRGKVQIFVRLYGELKKEFHKFLTGVM